MFDLCYVLLPFSDRSPAEAITGALAPFQRGGPGDVPDAMLAFHDETAWVQGLHEAEYSFTREGPGSLRLEGGDIWHLDTSKVMAEMERRGIRTWAVRFADLEPDLDAFFDAYVERLVRHPATGRYGRWLNPLGKWDWWDLGGRFDGVIAGGERRRGPRRSTLSSGPNTGRTVLRSIGDALDRALGSEEPRREIKVRADDNVELVSRLLIDARAGEEHALPGVLLLPPGAVEDSSRWIVRHPLGKRCRALDAAQQGLLGLGRDARWQDVATATYGRFEDHWAAAVAYHF